MRISDWSSDVCSSDLPDVELFAGARRQQLRLVGRIGDLTLIGLQPRDIILEPAEFGDLAVHLVCRPLDPPRRLAAPDGQLAAIARDRLAEARQIGRASCRERVCQYV